MHIIDQCVCNVNVADVKVYAARSHFDVCRNNVSLGIHCFKLASNIPAIIISKCTLLSHVAA